MASDWDLLQQYVQAGSQDAFRQVVDRHLNWVYSACLRLVHGDRALAEDVVQAVFLVLARKAPRLSPRTVLAGWLFRACRYCAANALEKEQVRHRHEQRAAAMRHESTTARTIPGGAGTATTAVDGDLAWPDGGLEELVPALEAGVASLGSTDRHALLLRFYEGKTAAQVGQVLGVSEEAAQKRVTRAVRKLRSFFAARGLAMTALGLERALAQDAVHSAPSGLASSVAAVAVEAVAPTAPVASLAQATLTMLTWARAKLAATLLATLLLTAGAASLVTYMTISNGDRKVRIDPATAGAADAAGERLARFSAVYTLGNKQALKRIPPPFIPERAALFPEGPDQITFGWDGQLRPWGRAFGNGGNSVTSLRYILTSVLGLKAHSVQGPQSLMELQLPGDWVVHAGATEAEKLQALAELVRRELSREIRFGQQEMEQEVIVVRGAYRFQPQPGMPDTSHVHVHGGEGPVPAGLRGGGGTGPLARFLEEVGNRVGVRMVNESTGPDTQPVAWVQYPSSFAREQPEGKAPEARQDAVLASLSRQTGLTFTREKRKLAVWFIDEKQR